jgi:ferredoxin
MATIDIDLDACAGCGTCEELCPSTFQLAGEFAEVIGDGEDCDLAEVVDACPTQAISVEGIEAAGRKNPKY